MKPRRLTVLVGVMVLMLVMRLWGPASSTVSEAVVRPRAEGGASEAANATSPTRQVALAPTGRIKPLDDLSAGTRDIDAMDGLRNAFAVRGPVVPRPAPQPAPAPRVAAMPKAITPEPMQTAPPRPSMQVIGSWRDAQGASVFLAGPSGVLQARVGDVLLTEFRVAEITPQQVHLKHLLTNQVVSLTVPQDARQSLTAATAPN